MRRLLCASLLVLPLAAGIVWSLSTAAPRAAAEDAPPPRKAALQKFMQAKLGISQQILEGLVVEDFERIEKGAAALNLLAAAEEWNVSDAPRYKEHSNQFRRVALQTGKMAKEKNLDAAALSYVQLTMSCIECHRFVRNGDADE